MPIMPRVKGKAEKIAYKILGMPPNMRRKKTANKVKKQLLVEYTMRVR